MPPDVRPPAHLGAERLPGAQGGWPPSLGGGPGHLTGAWSIPLRQPVRGRVNGLSFPFRLRPGIAGGMQCQAWDGGLGAKWEGDSPNTMQLSLLLGMELAWGPPGSVWLWRGPPLLPRGGAARRALRPLPVAGSRRGLWAASSGVGPGREHGLCCCDQGGGLPSAPAGGGWAWPWMAPVCEMADVLLYLEERSPRRGASGKRALWPDARRGRN